MKLPFRQRNTGTLACALSVAVVLVATIGLQYVKADTPFYTTGDHTIKATVKFDSDCWNEIYARANPKGDSHVLLNSQTVHNDDKPDSGPSETVYLKLKFKGSKFASVEGQDGRARLYVSIELADGSKGDTVNKYMAVSLSDSTWNFGTFNMKTDPSKCS